MNQRKTEPVSKLRILMVVFFALVFGVLGGTFLTYMCARFVPVVFTEWAGSFVCDGKMVFQSLSRSFQCYTSPTASYELGDKVYQTMFDIFVFPSIGVCSIILLTIFALTDYFVDRKTDSRLLRR